MREADEERWETGEGERVSGGGGGGEEGEEPVAGATHLEVEEHWTWQFSGVDKPYLRVWGWKCGCRSFYFF